MNTGPLKSYAIQARKTFIQAVTDRAAQLGITEKSIAPVQASSGSDKGVVVIGGAPFPASFVHARDLVVTAIARDGFRAVIEQVAYTWFNRLVALRYMEIHGYFDHGLRVLSDPNGGAVPQAVARLRDLDLPTLDKPKAVELAMAGNQDEALYRLILLAQCQHLAKPMPWLFDTRLHDGVDLLLPEHLLATDSLVRGLVNDIPEEDWKQGVEIIGWLYQFFISERKDEVIGSVVAPEDIPAATQLFTPNWIVQYLVQNSVGRLWMESYPHSTLRQHMPYYIEPAQQDPDVQAALDQLVVRDRTPESLTVLDPACGSGHILVEAFRLLFKIYLERGHRERDIPRLIFAHNLFGLDIDDRAAQLACMTLLFEARRHDARIFTDPPHVQVVAMQQSREGDGAVIEGSGFAAKAEAKELIQLFREAKTFGSLLRMPRNMWHLLGKIQDALPKSQQQQSFLSQGINEIIQPLLAQAQILGRQYQGVVANPPYMGGKGMNKNLKEFAKDEYPDSKADAFAMFIERGFELAHESGFNAMVTMQSWMFLSSYEAMRERLLTHHSIHTMAHLGSRAFGSISGDVVQTTACIVRNPSLLGHRPAFFRLIDGGEQDKKTSLVNGNHRFNNVRQSDFAKIPGMPVAYWLSTELIQAFASPSISEKAQTRLGMATADNSKFLRHWHEVSESRSNWKSKSRDIAQNSGARWFPYQKGGEFRKWYGNLEYLVDWELDGQRIQSFADGKTGKVRSHNYNLEFIFKKGITWNTLSSSNTSARISEFSLFDNAGSSLFAKDPSDEYAILALLNSTVVVSLIGAISPTLNYQPGDIAKIPCKFDSDFRSIINPAVMRLVEIARVDWNEWEASHDFTWHPLVSGATINSSFSFFRKKSTSIVCEALELEKQINTHLNKSYAAHLASSDVLFSQITLHCNPDYRFRDSTDSVAYSTRFCADVISTVVSYSVGCMMGRYSLDHEGLIYAHSANVGFDPGKYPTFPADQDGIIPLTDEAWFNDDATTRFAEFVSVAWPKQHLDENLCFVADALGTKTNETAHDTIRRYFANSFYKDHCQTYKKRPIYWLFSSGKHQAFQCLVYLHRYNGETLGRMRADYVIPLQGKLQGRQTALTEEVSRAGSTAQRKQAQKALDLIDKKIRELATFDDQLRTYADQRIEIDLDDGVKVNIRKFGTLIDLGPLGGADE